MITRKVFTDDSENELEFYLNEDNNSYLSAGQRWDGVSSTYNGYICLDKEDIDLLIKDLRKHLSEM